MGSIYMTSATPTSGYLGRCLPCSRPVRDTAIGGGDHRVISCPDCRGTLTAERVYGTRWLNGLTAWRSTTPTYTA